MSNSENKFGNTFFSILTEAVDDFEDDRAAMEASLDDDTDPSSFDVDMEADPDAEPDLNSQVATAKAQQAAAMESTIADWVLQFSEFLELLNGTSEGSIQSQLAQAEPDTILDRMKQSEQRKIARVATELAALTESFKGYLAQSENPQFKYV